MQVVVRTSDKKARDQMVAAYGSERAWRGLASDDFLRMADFVARHAIVPEIEGVALDPYMTANGDGTS